MCNTDESQPARAFTLTHGNDPVALTVARHRPSLIWFDGASALRAVETPGACVPGGERIVFDETGGIVLTLDGKDMRRSHALLLMPLQPGQVQWLSKVGWTEPVVETGELRNGGWQALSTQSAGRSEDQMRAGLRPIRL